MKKETKISIIIFCVVFIVAYVMTCFIPNEVLEYSAQNASILTFLGDALTGLRGVLSLAIALIAVLLIRIVDSDEKPKTDDKKEKVVKKENKK